jgi:hypothetical protein
MQSANEACTVNAHHKYAGAARGLPLVTGTVAQSYDLALIKVDMT